jgi:hypothetical protein
MTIPYRIRALTTIAGVLVRAVLLPDCGEDEVGRPVLGCLRPGRDRLCQSPCHSTCQYLPEG